MIKIKANKPFKFKQFTIIQDKCTMKVGTDGVLLGAWSDVAGASTILDIGTGSGIIAIMAAQRNMKAVIDAVEIDPLTYQQAKENMQMSPWTDRLSAYESRIQDYARTCTKSYDVIISNPPFFTGGTFSTDQNRNDVRHTIKMPTGELLIAVRNLLSKDGKFCVILPYIEGLRFKERAQQYNLYCSKMVEVHPKKDKPIERLLLQFERDEKDMKKDILVIQKELRNDYTEAYINLTSNFYLNMP